MTNADWWARVVQACTYHDELIPQLMTATTGHLFAPNKFMFFSLCSA
jgi:hypothetical protein